MSEVLGSFAEMIELEYGRLGHTLGWRFLYTPARTLASGTRLAFVALNPGGDKPHETILSVEEGNAYRTETWWPARQRKGLQVQTQLLYAALAERIPGTTAHELMDQTLALNFCPFRSPAWPPLIKPNESIAFSKRMWAKVLEVVQPAVFICLGNEPMVYLDIVLRLRGAELTRIVERPVGWGRVNYAVARYVTARGEVTMVRLPHLSRFQIFGRPQSHSATSEIADAISAALRRATPGP